MKLRIYLIVLITMVALFSFSQGKPRPGKYGRDETIIIFFNSQVNYPGQIKEFEFWSAPGDLDTVVLFTKRLNNLIDAKLKLLKDTSIDTGGIDEFYHHVAFVRQRGGKRDTIYASPLLQYWRKGKKDYIDTTGFFVKALGSFSLFGESFPLR